MSESARRLPPLGKHHSPLRYPGSKRQLLPWIVELLLLNGQPQTFIEPFAGGASVGLYIATAGLAERVVLGDADELVYAFWHIACFDTDWLIDAMWDVEVTVENWERFRAKPGRSHRDRALACLFINRTSFSGILHPYSGPIGGKQQRGANTIDCRFPKQTIDDRLRHVKKLADEGKLAAVRGMGYHTTVAWTRAAWPDEQFVYLDPPFWSKSQTLYRRSFTRDDHVKLAKWVNELEGRWLLSYDSSPDVASLYGDLGHVPYAVRLGYLAAPGRRSAVELVFTTETRRPKATETWKETLS